MVQQTEPIQLHTASTSGWWRATEEDRGRPTWPVKTDVCCWWCCHTFDTVPIPLPIEYESRTREYKVHGTFCSWSCAKAYNIASNNPHWGHRSFLLYMLYLKNNPGMDASSKLKGIVVAPARTTLKMFGGGLSIKRFRAVTGSCQQTTPMCGGVSLVDVGKVHRCCCKGTDHKDDVNQPFIAVSSRTPLSLTPSSEVKSEALKLRRNKPLKKKSCNLIEDVLGLTSST